MSDLTETDIYHFREGTFFRAYDKLGAHPEAVDGVKGTCFAVWAPNAAAVHVIGDFNGWNHDSHPMTVRPDESGIWELFIPQIGKGTVYKYYVRSRYAGYAVEKSDPYAFMCEEPPRTGAVVWTTSTSGKMSNGSATARGSMHWMHPGPSMRCIWAPGGASPRMATAR